MKLQQLRYIWEVAHHDLNVSATAQSLFTSNGVQVVVGAQAGPPDDVVQAYLDGTLATGTNICDH